MKELEPLMMLVGRWQGKGKGSYGPFSAEMDVEERGRWLLMRQKIKIPVVGTTTYVSTQIYGYDHDQLTLDFFDTAGSFHFIGNRDGDILKFHFKDSTVEKTSLYWKDGDGIAFDYVSLEKDSESQKKVHFEGAWRRDE